jgi:peptidoglycan/LPS O-acetylase OafA/YrhL
MKAVQSSHRFEVLDGIRGVAALMIVMHHVSLGSKWHLLPGAWVSVDLFFALSGFVIMHSYGEKILAGMAFTRFALLRLIRLMPLYMVGVLMGVAPLVADVISGAPEAPSALHLLMLTGAQALLVPYVGHTEWLGAHTRLGGDSLFPLDPPAWSLFFELAGNFAFFGYLIVCRQIPRWLVAVALGVYVWLSLRSGVIHGGWSTGNVLFGVPRFASEFALGAVLYQFRPQPGSRLAIPAALAFALVLVGFNIDGQKVALANAVLMCPLAIWLASGVQAGPRLQRACHLLGEMSYPIYVIHLPLYAAGLYWFNLGAQAPAVQALLITGGGGLLALALARVDLRLRRQLLRRLT